MFTDIAQLLRSFGPVFLTVWAVTILCVLLWPQRYFNSLLLMFSLLVTLLFASGFFGENGGSFLLICFLLIMLALFLVPVLLIANGVQMIRRESPAPAHLLSLALGLVVGAGEIAAVIYVVVTAYHLPYEQLNFWMLAVTLTVFYFSFLVLSFVAYSVFIQILPHRMDFDYVIIHGCGLLEGERMTRLLSDRVDRAMEIYRKCRRKPVLIPSGGQGPDEKISEAKAMTDHLLANGIPAEHILPEDQSQTTRENLLNSRDLILERPGRKKTALVSSNYHVYRCLRLARELGFRCTGIGARVALYYWPSALIREFIAVFVTRGFLLWALAGWLLFLSPLLLFL